jgi:hypothetical protein
VDAEVKSWMENIQNSVATAPGTPAALVAKEPEGGDGDLVTADPAADPSPEYKYTAAANRVKRALKPPSNK